MNKNKCYPAVICTPCSSQYGVSVIKYDRRGFKPRPRQLLLTNTFAVLVDRTKIKQRMDYTALRGETSCRGRPLPSPYHLQLLKGPGHVLRSQETTSKIIFSCQNIKMLQWPIRAHSVILRKFKRSCKLNIFNQKTLVSESKVRLADMFS